MEVPVLIKQLEELLAATARHRERVAARLEAWDAWYEDADRITEEHGPYLTAEEWKRYATIPSESLPQLSPEDGNYRDPYELKQEIIEKLHRFGDRRAAPVLIAALSDRACIPAAARALLDIHADNAVSALLNAVTLIDLNGIEFDPLLATLQYYGVSMAQARERFEAETSPAGRVRLMHLMTQLPDDGTGRPDKSKIKDSLILLALDHRSSHYWAISALDRIDNHAREYRSSEGLPADIVRLAIGLAAHGNPPGYGRELMRMLRYHARLSAASVTRAVEAILIQDPPEADVEELSLALRLALRMHASELDDPVRMVRALYRLSSHPEVGDQAATVLRRSCWELLFPQMVQDDDALREEARIIFEAIALPAEHAWFARFLASQPFWRRLLHRFRRRSSA